MLVDFSIGRQTASRHAICGNMMSAANPTTFHRISVSAECGLGRIRGWLHATYEDP